MNQEEEVWLYRNNLFWLVWSMGMLFLLSHGSQTHGSKHLVIKTNLTINRD